MKHGVYLNVLIWRKLQLSCVKYIRISRRHIKMCGKRDSGVIANFLINLAVKEFWKSANVCQGYA